MAAEPVMREEAATPLLCPPLTEDERTRLAQLGISEDEVARTPGLRFAGIFADDPDFVPALRKVFRKSRGRDLPE